MTNSSPMVRVDGLSVAVDGGFLLREASFEAGAGRLVALVGASGAGKTTLLRSLTGLLPPGSARVAGTVEVLGHDIFAADDRGLRELRRTRMAFVGQDPGSGLNPRMKVRSLIRELAVDPAELPTLLAEVQLPAEPVFTARRPGALSGGQQRRVALARALARHPDLLLLDEPTAGLHPTLRDEIGDLLVHLARTRGLTIVFACHDPELVARIADDVVDLNPGASQAAPSTPLLETASLASLSASGPEPSDPGPATAAGATPTDGRIYAVRAGMFADAEPVVAEREPLLSVRGVVVEFPGGPRVLHDVDLVVAAGSAVGVVGPSGSGKTSLARAVVGLQGASSGSIALDGLALRPQWQRRNREQRRRIQLVPQNPLGALNPSRTVGETLARPLRLHRRSGSVAARVAELLEQVELESGFAQRYPHELSGGQRQRVSIARALAAEPEVLICDEITSALDRNTAAAIMDLLAGLREERGVALVLIAHDLELIAERTESVTVLDSGRVVESGSTATVFAAPAHAATRALFGGATVAGR
ncbi:ABC transporter ATP-binding protein [Nocardia sp. NPDC058058]|uniref:ABC transporter ATP-binding protein n=1 Tax=Nocardia sp. NPDC058058 TaxID=3346317 RepID=UPI0036DB2C29